MRRNKTILDVLREAQSQTVGKDPKGGASIPGEDSSTKRDLRTTGGFRKKKPVSREGRLSLWGRCAHWFKRHPSLAGGMSLALLFLLVFGFVRLGGGKKDPSLGSDPQNQGKVTKDPASRAPFSGAKESKNPPLNGNTPRLMGGRKLNPTAEPASNEPPHGVSVRSKVGGLKPETWATRKIRFFRISSYTNPKKTVIGYASSMARFLRKKGFLADHAWLKKRNSKQLIVYVKIPESSSKAQEARLFQSLKSLGFVRKGSDKIDKGFQFDFRTLTRNVGRAKFRVRVGVGKKG